jgi:hypothetical protein
MLHLADRADLTVRARVDAQELPRLRMPAELGIAASEAESNGR